ncbi:hypothetical protein VTO42DRAFT_6074 [Malbranchea cinnamomea]
MAASNPTAAAADATNAPNRPSPSSINPAPTTTTTAISQNSNQKRLPETYSALVASVASFLAVSIHQILYLRSIYPQYTFLPVRQFNHPVRQSRHPRVCSWISDACTAVQAQLLKCTVAAVSVVILSVSSNRPLERYTFDMTQMPTIPASDVDTPFERPVGLNGTAQQQRQKDSNVVDLEAQYRAVLARLASACARLTPLPPDEEYLPTLHIVLRPGADAPAGMSQEEQLWIAADPEHFDSPCSTQQSLSLSDSDFSGYRSSRKPDGNNTQNGNEKERTSRARAKTVPVRTVDAGEVKLEVWVEEAKGKFEVLDRIHSEHAP